MKRYIQTLLFLLIGIVNVNATHNRAGEITLTQLDEFTYEITITTFTYTLSQADRSQLEVQWGDNTYSTSYRISITKLPNYYQKNVYTAQHSFPGAGTFEIVVQDPNRNLGVKNIPNSVNVVFSIKTVITINPAIGQNSTPVLLNPPIDRAALGQIFIHNPAAYDPDGDSISYKLTVCTEEDGKPIEGYELPAYSDTLFIDAVTGDLTWKNPKEIGIYNIAIDIEEWRMGVKIGNIIRDMQIEVYETDNHAPVIDSMGNYCVEAGNILAINVVANDADNDLIDLTAAGGPFIVNSNPAQFTEITESTGPGHSESTFLWQTDCSHARQQMYTVVFKAEDDDPETILVDLKTVNIKVIGPAPETPNLIPSSNSITVTWKMDSCEHVVGYQIYRKDGPAAYVPDTCTNGIPKSTGYQLAGISTNRSDTIFVDEGGGSGLEQGAEYCYVIVSVYPDGSFSFPSNESCTPLVAGTPSFLQASVIKDSPSGDIELRWAQPRDLDTIPALGPYEYIITRSNNDLFGNSEDQVFIKQTPDITDTVFIDQDVDTEVFPYSYKIELYNNEPGFRFRIGDPEIREVASSLYPELVGTDNQIEIKMVKNVPWINYDYTIYRDNDGSGSFEQIGFTTEPYYLDKGLVNMQEYCYRIESTGWRSVGGRRFENSNISHINCTQPYDSIPPCIPMLNGKSFCDEFYNYLTWSFPDEGCLEDVEGYKLYYSPNENDSPTLISEYESLKTDTSYLDYKLDESLTGCYYISAIDSFGNESALSARLCLDECSNYILPNVFSPNNDQINDLYFPLRTAYVEKVDFQVYNRWGLLVFNTDDPDINWDGKLNESDKIVSPGVYYYICEVFEPRLGGLESYTLTGFIYIYSGEENDVFIEK